ncbi:hypothetical protein CVT25_015305 [Psilocybe cyanescens]|uniref:Hydrophobin n=1 Tax=Psilocybe cyanescens TaxID=93625 RepID=A0A409WH51_PSICY|nr:hypothetical protein CVT25_015305 [Psilocybe cyanescens]
MFSKVALFTAASMAVFVAAGTTQNSCNTGDIQCCNQMYSAQSAQGNWLATLVGVVVGPLTGQIGANCSPISAIGAGGNSCTEQPVCCTSNHYNGLVNVGCTPVNVNA